MKICPVCNDSFADELNFCDIDGTRLAREGSAQEKNKWWSLLGAALLVGALVISAASIFFLPKARLSNPVGSSEPQAVPSVPRSPARTAESASVAATAASSESESAPTDSLVPEVKKRDKGLANNNVSGPAPNPKAAALAAEDADKRSQSTDSHSAAPAPPTNPEPPPAVQSVSDTRPAENKPQPPPELKREPKSQPVTAKVSDNDKKKNDDKNKKKSGGFLRVFKKIFGKD